MKLFLIKTLNKVLGALIKMMKRRQ